MNQEEEIKERAVKKKEGELEEELGRITIAEEVIESIAATSASKVEGLGEMKSSMAEDLVGIFGSKKRGVETELTDNGVIVSIKIAVKYGNSIHQVAKNIQKTVINDVEEMTGLSVNKVDVFVEKLQTREEEEVKESELYEKALAHLAENPQGVTLAEMGESLGLEWQSLIDPVNELVEEGMVDKKEDKYYPTENL